MALFLKDRGVNAVVLEKSGRAGGLAGSFRVGPYTFDHSGHLLHTNNPEVLDLIRNRLHVPLHRIDRRAVCLVDGRLVPFPYQQNLFFQTPERVGEALKGFFERRKAAPKNFHDWIHATCGDGVGRQFMYPYNSKLWNIDLRRMSADWVPRFIPSSGAADILKSAFLKQKDPWGYNAVFYYPKRGGMGTVAGRLAASVSDRTILNTSIRSIDLNRRVVRTDAGEWRYERLVSTIPLPQFLRLAGRAVPDVCRATGVTVFNVGLRKSFYRDFHWCYVPDPTAPFYRFGVYSNISPSSAPRGCGALYVECAAPPDRLGRFRFSDVRRHLERLGFISGKRAVDTVHRLDIRHAYPIPLIGLARWRDGLIRRLQRRGVELLGRFGAWRYVAISDVIVEAKEMASRL